MVDSGFGIRIPAASKTYRHTMPGDYSVSISTNGQGMRGITGYETLAGNGIERICLLGDSFVFGYGVEDSQVVSEALQRALNESRDTQHGHEVLNFGVSGYGQAEQLNLWQNKVRNYRCDTVIAFYYSNDPGNNRVSSLYKLDDNGHLTEDQDSYLPGVKVQSILYGPPLLGDLIAHSHLWSFIRNRGSQIIHANMLKKKGLKDYSAAGDDTAMALTIALIRKLKTSIEESGAKFAVFVIPAIERGSNQLITNYPFDRLMDLGDVVLDGREWLEPSDYHGIDTHWNSTGHLKAADSLSAWIIDGG
jgi:hypothetical protein